VKKSALIAIVIAVVLGTYLIACGTPAPVPQPTEAQSAGQPASAVEKILKVGVLAPFTGPSARVGEEFKYAVTMAFDAIAWKVGHYKIEIVWIDGESDPEKATRSYEAAISRDKIDVGLLNWDATVAVAVMELSAKYKIPHFFGMGTTDLVDQKYKSDPKYHYWMAKGWPTPSKLTISYIKTLEEAITKGIWPADAKRVALYGNDDDWSRGFTGAMAAQFREAGWEIVGEQYVPIGETDFYPFLTKLKALDAPLIAGTMDDAAGFPALIKQAREIGLKSFILADGLGWMGEWYQMAGEASDYVIDQIPGWTSAKAQTYRDDFQKRWGIEPSPSAAGLAYDEANFFIKLLQETFKQRGELTSEILYQVGQEQLMTGKLTYTDGILMKEYKITAETAPDFIVGQGYFTFPVIQYFGGVGKTVWPAEVQEADLVLPPYMK